MNKLSKLTTTILFIFIAVIILAAFSPLKKIFKNRLPISLGYVYSGSMEPTIRTGDGYILINSKEYAVNDIITFEPKVLKDNYITHRIIEITDDNKFITRGDYNRSTDQEGGEPFVNKEQVYGKVFDINNKPVIIPNLGIVSKKLNEIIEGLNVFKLMSIFMLIYLFYYIIENYFIRSKRIRRKTLRLIDIAPYFDLVFLALFVITIINAIFICLTIKSWKHDEASYTVVTTKGVSSPLPGEKFNKTMSLENLIPLPFVTIFEPERQGVEVSPKKIKLPWKEVVEYNLTIEAPEKVGYYTENIIKNTYPDVLPEKWLDYLYSKDKFIPMIIIFGPGLIMNVGLYIWWVKRWQVGRGKVMEYLIPFRKIIKKFYC